MPAKVDVEVLARIGCRASCIGYPRIIAAHAGCSNSPSTRWGVDYHALVELPATQVVGAVQADSDLYPGLVIKMGLVLCGIHPTRPVRLIVAAVVRLRSNFDGVACAQLLPSSRWCGRGVVGNPRKRVRGRKSRPNQRCYEASLH